MFKKPCFRTLFDGQHANASQTLLKSARKHYYHIFLSLWVKWSWKLSLLVISEILGLFVSTLTADNKRSRRDSKKWPQALQMQLYKKQKTEFLNFLHHFWNLLQFSNISKKRGTSEPMYSRNYGLWKTLIEKCLESPVSEHCSTVNTLKDPKHCCNLYGSPFIIFSHQSHGNTVGKYIQQWYLEAKECLLIYWLLITSILFVIGRIYRSQFRCNYLRNKNPFLNFLLRLLYCFICFISFSERRG